MSPFDSAKYQALLDGLEAVEIPYSELITNNDAFRFDSDYFKKEYLHTFKLLKKGEFNEFKDLTESIKSFGAYSLCNDVEYLLSGIPFLRCINIKNGIVDFNDVLYIDDKANELLWKSEVKPKMLLLTMSGSVGNSAIAQENWIYPINSNQDIAKIEVLSSISSYFLNIFLNCKYGKSQMQRMQVGSIQQHLFLWQIEKLIAPIYSKRFQSQIENIAIEAYSLMSKSDILYNDAKQTLLDELGLSGLTLSTDTKTVRAFDDSFGTSGRLDAEYYHPKYDEITDHIKKYPLGFTKLGDIADVIKSMEPGSDYYQETGVPFVRVSNLTTSGITAPDIHLPESYVKQFEGLNPRKDDILITKDGTIGISYKVEKDLDVFLSGAILRLVLNNKNINPDCLTLLLNSLVVAMQAERDAGGSIIQHWKVSEVKEVLIPLIDMSVQENVAKLVQQSFGYRTKSKELLNAAKRAVEIAIEQDEQAALDWLSSNAQLPE